YHCASCASLFLPLLLPRPFPPRRSSDLLRLLLQPLLHRVAQGVDLGAAGAGADDKVVRQGSQGSDLHDLVVLALLAVKGLGRQDRDFFWCHSPSSLFLFFYLSCQ